MDTIVANAADTGIAATLSELGSPDKGTLVYLEIRKKGTERGVAGNKVLYGDDVTAVLLWSGFEYKDLVERSYQKLHQMWSNGDLSKKLQEAVEAKGYPGMNASEMTVVIQETEDSFLKVIRDQELPPDETGMALIQDELGTIPQCWKPLEINGQMIRGAKVYAGRGDPNNPRAPKPGAIYIDGVKLGERILEPAKNGHWHAKHKIKTVAKDILRSWLPIGLYVRYSLDRDQLKNPPKVGKQASPAAKTAGIPIDPEALRQLFKLVP